MKSAFLISGAALRRAIMESHDDLDIERRLLLESAALALDQALQAERTLAKEGLITTNARGAKTANPLINVGAQARARLARALKSLQL